VSQHLDIRVDDLASAARWVESRGARLAGVQPQEPVRVMISPDGHPFSACSVESGRRAGTRSSTRPTTSCACSMRSSTAGTEPGGTTSSPTAPGAAPSSWTGRREPSSPGSTTACSRRGACWSWGAATGGTPSTSPVSVRGRRRRPSRPRPSGGPGAGGEAGVAVNLRCCSVFDAPLTVGSYDLVYDSGCFHHLPPHRRKDYVDPRGQGPPAGRPLRSGVLPARGGSGYTDLQVYERASLGGGLGYSEDRLRALWEAPPVLGARPPPDGEGGRAGQVLRRGLPVALLAVKAAPART